MLMQLYLLSKVYLAKPCRDGGQIWESQGCLREPFEAGADSRAGITLELSVPAVRIAAAALTVEPKS
jgi:hypothetical protein